MGTALLVRALFALIAIAGLLWTAPRALADGLSLTLASLVDPFVGTGSAASGDAIDDFPGADVPFGMLQWSPDTPSQNEGGGYDFGDRAITGFSLTHLSGPGCGIFGDIGFLPVTRAVESPMTAQQPFAHASEQAAPGWYAVTLGDPAIRAELTVTQRTGLGRFTFPAAAQSHVLVNASS